MRFIGSVSRFSRFVKVVDMVPDGWACFDILYCSVNAYRWEVRTRAGGQLALRCSGCRARFFAPLRARGCVRGWMYVGSPVKFVFLCVKLMLSLKLKTPHASVIVIESDPDM